MYYYIIVYNKKPAHVTIYGSLSGKGLKIVQYEPIC